MAYVEDRWMRNGEPTVRHGNGRRYRVRWNDRDGKECARSFAGLAEAELLAGQLAEHECPTAAETIGGLCRIHGKLKARLDLQAAGTYVHRIGACVMPDPAPGVAVPDGTVRICGDRGQHDVGGAWFCAEHFASITAWHQAQLEQVALIDRDWMMGSEATGRQIVYYLRRESDGLIKIGTSARFATRLRNLRTQHGRLRVLLTHVGDRGREQDLHATFSGWWVEGEWHQPGAGLLDWIAEVRRRPVNVQGALPETEPLDYILGLKPAPEPDWEAIMARTGRASSAAAPAA
jgi:hypothetical protein